MMPGDLKKMFGLTDTKDVNMANNIWKMLDDMADSDPSQYKKFIQKNMKQGFEDAKQKKEEKEKHLKIKARSGFLLMMSANLNQKPLDSNFNEKVLITKQPWSEIAKKFSNTIKIYFNIAHSDRIKDLKSKSTGKIISKYSIKDLTDIQFFYYSMQGPSYQKDENNKVYFCMILNSTFYSDILSENGGKKMLMGLCMSYLQQRLSLDKNPLLKFYNPQEYRRLAFYNIDKYTIQISDKLYNFVGKDQPEQVLLEKEVDKKLEKEIQQKQKQKVKLTSKQQQIPQIKFKQQKKQQSTLLPQLKIHNEPPPQPKKVLIEVLKEQQNVQNNQIAYEMKQAEKGYYFQFLLVGVESIKEVDLQMKADTVRLKVKGKKQLLINLKKSINQQAIKAKFKKKQGCLIVQAPFK